MKEIYRSPEIEEIQMRIDRIMAASAFSLSDYESNGDPFELEF